MQYLVQFFYSMLLISFISNGVIAQGVPEVAGVGEMTGLSSDRSQWVPIQENASYQEIASILAESGWQLPEDAELEAYAGATAFERIAAPGVKELLLVPQEGAATEFSPLNNEHAVDLAFWGSRLDSDEIKNEILEGMQAAIDAICEMPARPREIRASASALGIVEVEAFWDASEVCVDQQ
jgi:hypothetical protein